MRTLRLRSTLRSVLIPVLALAPLVACRGGDDGNTTGSGGDTSSSSGKMTSSSSSSSKASSSSSGMTTNSSSGVVSSSSSDASSSTGMGGMGGMGGMSATSSTTASSTAATTAASTTASTTAMSSSTGLPTTETNCSDGLDDDMSGGTDCADTDCDTAPACSTIVINEINYDNVGGPDTAEFVEIYNPGPNSTNLDGVALLLVNGNTNPVPTVYSPSFDLSGKTLAPGEYLVVAPADLPIAPGAQRVDFPTSSPTSDEDVLQNGGANISAKGDAVVLFDNDEKVLLDAISYEAPVLSATISGASYDLYEGTMPFPALLPGELSVAPDASLIRFPNGEDTGQDNVDVRATSLRTPGAMNQVAEICNDMIDNDDDMAIDCADTNCSADASCMEICTDGIDNNANMQIDCMEASCDMKACGPNGLTCLSTTCGCPGMNMENCTDGMDNDCDGLNNCADPDCAAAPICGEDCDDGMDNNGNSLVDCQESTCDTQVCGTNGKTCISSMCSCAGGATETACGDTTDNDCDGMVDCMDSDCAGAPECMTPVLFINEFHYDNAGTDVGEGVEIAGTAGTNLSGYSIVHYNGSNGAVISTTMLTGTIPDQQNGFGTIWFPIAALQNDNEGLALVNGTTCVQFISYEGPVTATAGPCVSFNMGVATPTGMTEASNSPVGQSIQLTGTSPFMWTGSATATPNAVNNGQTF